MKFLVRILLLVGLCCAPFALAATTYTISPTGNDASSGIGINNAWKTWAHACTVVVAGDTVQQIQGTNGENYYLPTLVGGPINLSTCPAGAFTWKNAGSATPVVTDLLQILDSSVGCGALTIGCTTVTWSTSSDYPCIGTCQLWKSTGISSASFNYTESFFYIQNTGSNNPSATVRRPPPRSFYINNLAQTCDTTLCVGNVSTTQAQADTLCGCPGMLNGRDCAVSTTGYGSVNGSQFPANKWWCGPLSFEYVNTGIGPYFDTHLHGMNVGDIALWNQEAWTQGMSRLASASAGLATMTGPLINGRNGYGFILHANITKVNEPSDLQAGEIYLDRCPTGCPGNVPEATWFLYFAADTSKTPAENPQTGTLFAAQMPGQCPDPQNLVGTGLLLQGTGVIPAIQGLNFYGGNWCPSTFGYSDKTSQYNIPATISFTNGNGGSLQGATQIAHTAGWALELLGNANHWTIGDSGVGDMAWFDMGSGCIRIGVAALYTDLSANVPNHNTIQNLACWYGQEKNPSGEPVGIYIGNGHDNLVTHVDCAFWYTGCYQIGDILNRDTMTSFGTQVFNNWVTYSTCSGVGQSGVFNGLLSDYGCGRISSALSTGCPMTAGDPGTTIANFCNGFQFVFFHDNPTNWQYSGFHGGTGAYFEQGTSYALCYACILARMGDDPLFFQPPAVSSGNFPNNVYDLQYNTVLNSILAFGGECEYNSTYAGTCPPPSVSVIGAHMRLANTAGSAQNQQRFRVLNSIELFDSSIGQRVQDCCPANWTGFSYGSFGGGPTAPTAVDPITVFKYASNIVWDTRQSFPQFIQNTTSAPSSTFNTYVAFPWGFDTGNNPTEDVGSVNCDPGFVAPFYPTDDWHPTNKACLDKIGWTFFDPTLIGRVNPTVFVSTQSTPYYQRPVLSATDYCSTCGNLAGPITSWNADGGSGLTQWK